MSIKSAGGEFSLIKIISENVPTNHRNLTQGIGDDAAVIKHEKASFILVTTDMLVENTHFKQSWSSPYEIGIKAVECNLSDIAAMGGNPTFMFVSLILPQKTSILWSKKLYMGMKISCNRHDVTIAGGDTTMGDICAINITMLGTVTSAKLCLRSHAKPGDFLAVTGCLGGSAAGLEILLRGEKPSIYLFEKHIVPKCKLDEALAINSIVNAMIDISDGLSNEIHHICDSSKTGAVIYEIHIPIHKEVKDAAKQIGKKATSLALKGGEDLELLFSFNPCQIKLLNKTGINYHIIGKITKDEKERVLITKSFKRRPLKKEGYDHFN